MILVLLGTQNNSFHRLLEEIDICIEQKVIQEEVIAQIGGTKYKSKNIKTHKLMSNKKLEQLIEEANLIITHGGVGSIISSIKKGKKVIAIPRKKEYEEHVNNHQEQIIETLSQEGYIKGLTEVSQLPGAINEIKNFTPKTFQSGTTQMLAIIEEYISQH